MLFYIKTQEEKIKHLLLKNYWSDLKTFSVNDLLVVHVPNTVFYQFMSISALMRTRTVVKRNTIRKISNIFFKTTCLISEKFGDSDLMVVSFHNTVYGLWVYVNQWSNEDPHYFT